MARTCFVGPRLVHFGQGESGDLQWAEAVEMLPRLERLARVRQAAGGEVLSWKLKPGAGRHTLDRLPYLQLKLLVESIRDPRHMNFANVGGM